MAYERVSYEVIKNAVQNDEAAIAQIVLHYRNYIQFLSLREAELADGSRIKYVDEEMALRLETKLMESVGKFKLRATVE